MSDRPIDIHIDRLILHGLDPRDGERIADETRRELEHLIASHGLPWHWSHGAVAVAPDVEVPAGQSAAGVGATIANAIYRGGK